MSTVILDSTDTSYRVSNSNTSVRGATGNQAVLQDAGLTGNTFDANVERIGFSGLTTDYTYRQSGNTIQVFNSSSSTIPVAKIALGSATELLSFANGTVELKLVPAAVFGTAPTITLGGQTVVATTTATPVSAAPVTIPPAILEALVATYPITLPSFSVAAKSTTATEGGEAEFTVTLANPSATTTTNVKYTFTNVGGATNADTNDEVITGTGVTADISTTTAGVDGPYTGTLHFAPGATTATIKLPIAFDLLAEAGEGMSLTLSNPTGAGSILGTSQVVTTTFAEASAATFTMTSNAVAGVATQEGQTITFTVTPTSIVNAPTLLNLQVVGEVLGSYTSTTNAADFGTLSSLTFAAGSTASQQVTILVAADTSPEGTEAYRAQMLDAVGVEKAFVKGIIADALPTLTLSTANATVNEGGIAIYTVTASAAAPAGGLSVPYTLAGTATTVTDYTVPAGNITIAAGATTGTLTLTTLADTLTEAGAAETVIVSLGTTIGANLSTVTGATTATTTITDSSQTPIPGAVTLSSSAATITETAGANVVTYTVTLGSAAPAGGVTIPYTLSGAATLTTDYTGAAATTGNFTIAAGATTGTLVLTAVTDSLTESAAEAITVTLGTLPTGYTLATGTTNTTTTAITDSSIAAPVAAFSLTTAADTVTGTAYNSITGFIDASTGSAGAASTWNLTDTIAPAASANAAISVSILNTGTNTSGAISLAGYSATNVPTLGVRVIDSSAATANSTTFDLGGLTGLTTTNVALSSTISTSSIADTVLLTSIPAASKLGVSSNGQYTNVSGTWVTAATAGSADTVTLALDGRNGNITIGTGFETAAITTTGTGNREGALTGSTIKTVTVAGTDFRVDTVLDSTVTSFSAAAASGVVNVALTPGSTLTATGGSGTSDVIQLLAAGTTPTVTGFETVVAGAAATFDLLNVTGNTVLGVAVGAGTSGNVAFTNVLATQNTLAFSGNYNTARSTDVTGTAGALATGGTGTIGYTLKTQTGTADTLNITVDNGGTAKTGSTSIYTVNGLITATAEVVNVTPTNWIGVTFSGITQTVTAAAAATFTVAATTANLIMNSLTTSDTSGGATYNFGSVSGTVTATTANSTGTLTYTGGTGVDTVNNTASVSTSTTKTQTFNLGAGNDVMNLAVDRAGTAVTDKIVVNGEAGDDIFAVTPSATANQGAVTIDGGTGTDTLKTTGTGAAAGLAVTKIANIEKINFENSALGANALALTVDSGYADSVVLTDVSGSGTALSVGVTSTGNVDISGWTGLGWTSGTDLLAVTGSGTIKGSSTLATSVTGGSSADTITTGAALSTVTGGLGVDNITLGSANAVVDIVTVAAGDSVAVVAGTTTAGTLTGYDNVTNFHLGDTVTNSDNLNMGGTAIPAVIGTFAQNGTDSTLQLNTAAAVRSHSITTGVITFDDVDTTFAAAVALTTAGDVAAAEQYLQTNDIGTTGDTLAFVATISGVAHTYVYTQSSGNAGGDFIDLVGVTATSVTATNATTASMLFIS